MEFSDVLYDNEKLVKALSNALTDDGVLVVQVGMAAILDDPPIEHGREGVRVKAFREHLIASGFRFITQYSEAHCGFGSPWRFQIAMKRGTSFSGFYANEAEVDLAASQRILPTIQGESALRFFDGATLAGYQQLDRTAEIVWCLSNKVKCGDCHGLDPEKPHIPASPFAVREGRSEGGIGVFTTKAAAKEAYIGLDETTQGLFVPPTSFELLKKATDMLKYPTSRCLAYLKAYGRNDDSHVCLECSHEPMFADSLFLIG